MAIDVSMGARAPLWQPRLVNVDEGPINQAPATEGVHTALNDSTTWLSQLTPLNEGRERMMGEGRENIQIKENKKGKQTPSADERKWD